MAEILNFPEPPFNPGNGAREAVIAWMDAASDHECTASALRADDLLLWLWREGFWVVPLPPSLHDPIVEEK